MKKHEIRLKRLICLTFVLFLILNCSTAAVENDPNGKGVEVLTTVEQRMQKLISVNFRDTPIEDVLSIIASQAQMDMIISPNVKGTVTVKLTDVPLQEALANILASQGFVYVADKNIVRVATRNEISEKTEMLVSKIYRITYADVDEVEKALKKFISNQGSLSSNKGTSNIIVTDTESKIKAVDTFIAEIDRITPQILVEARIYDITSKDRLDLGVEWQAGRRTTYDSDDGITTIGENPSNKNNAFVTGIFGGATSKTESTDGALRFGFLSSSVDIDAIIKAQQEKAQAKLLANPRILVLDNEKANIKIISEIPYQELTETSGGGSIGTTQFREVGVELEVTPHLARNNMVRLHLKPKFSVTTGDVVVGGFTVTSPQPVVDKREADTTLLVQSGQTVVLGGLRKKDISQQLNKIPLLGDLPGLGFLFRFEGEDTVTSELVVFVTPWIIEQPIMTEEELKMYDVTDFNGPEVTYTRAEKENK